MPRHALPLMLAVSLTLAGCGSPSAQETDSAQEIDRLVKRMGDPRYQTREEAYQKLFDWGCTQPECVLALLPRHVEDAEVQDRCEKLRARIPRERMRRRMLGKAGKEEGLRKAVEALLDRPSPTSLQELVARAGRRGPEFAEIIEWVLSLEANSRTRCEMVKALENEKSYAPQIARFLEDPDSGVRQTALSALDWVGEKSMTPRIAKLLD